MKRFSVNFACLLLLGLLLTPLLLADTGPKPYADFALTYAMQPSPTLLNATLLECQNADCSDAHPMLAVGPQGIRCSDQTSCSALAYGFSPYLRLSLQFSDKTRVSNIFSPPGFGGSYDVAVQPNDLNVQSTGFFPQPNPRPGPYTPPGPTPMPGLTDILVALVITLLIELPVAAIAFYLLKKPLNLLWLVAGINIVTVPALWITLVPLGDALTGLLNENIAVGAIFAFLLLELAVIIVEALALWKLSARFDKTGQMQKPNQKKNSKAKRPELARPPGLSLLQAAMLSIAMNVASMVGGFILLAIISAILG